MKLQTTITQTKELDILLPLFYKEENYGTTYLAVLDEGTLIKLYVSTNGDFVSFIHSCHPKDNSEDILKAMKSWEAIKEKEFLSAYDDALSAISLRPKLNYQEAQDFLADLNVLDLKRNVNKNDSPVPDRITVISEIPEIKP